ncbi:MAG: VOC family protein [Agromyces sp.]
MSKQMVFINVTTTDLERARAFYTAIGGSINPQFSDDNAICVVLSETIYFMVLRREFMQTFTEKPIGEPAASVSAMYALSYDNRADVDRVVQAGIDAGGIEPAGSPRDLGFMYSRQLEDPDGNILEFFWMDSSNVSSDGADPEAQERLAEFGG